MTITVLPNAKRLFYNKYAIKASLQYPHVTVLRRPLSVNQLIKLLAYRKQEMDKTLNKNASAFQMMQHYNVAPITEDIKIELSVLLMWLNENNIRYSVRTVGWYETRDTDQITIYTNNQEYVDEFLTLSGVNKEITHSKQNPYEIKQLQTKYKFRVFLKHMIVNDETKAAILSFIETNKDTVNIAKATRYFLNSKHREYAQTSYFIDFADAKAFTFIAMIAPELLGKKYNIVN